MAIVISDYKDKNTFNNTVSGSLVEDRDERVFIGIDMPFRRDIRSAGYFASTSTTMDAVKNNIKNLLLTNRGERFFQPQLGTSLRNFLFEQFTEDTLIGIQNEIVEVFKSWLPFVEIKDLRINMDDVDDISGKNKLNIKVVFFIKENPNMLDSVQVEII